MYHDASKCKGGGWTYDPGRNMWVCGSCHQPSKMHEKYRPDCLWCGEIFTLQVYSDEAYQNATCRECGGTNEAGP